MRFNTLQQWLTWQESLNPKEIDLGLQRVEQVLQRLGLASTFACPVITVAGTNGKGSSVAMLEALLRAHGYRVGCYTSPHVLAYNERVRIDGAPVSDARLCAAFEDVDQARAEVALTYFEFGTLAALQIFAEQSLDVVVLEVGLGGRLDAVNVIDADVALISTVHIDHTDWLGHDIETIAAEKAGIMRPGRPVTYAGTDCPQAIRTRAQQLQAPLFCAGDDYIFSEQVDGRWQLKMQDWQLDALSRPALPGSFQVQNAAGVLMALHCLPGFEMQSEAIERGLQAVQLPGRYQLLQTEPAVILDVAHNPQAAHAIAELLQQTAIDGRTLAVIAMLKDKAIGDVIDILAPQVDVWFSAGLGGSRGLDADSMAKIVQGRVADVKLCSQSTVAEACRAALAQAQAQDRVIVLGSFLTVSEAWQTFNG